MVMMMIIITIITRESERDGSTLVTLLLLLLLTHLPLSPLACMKKVENQKKKSHQSICPAAQPNPIPGRQQQLVAQTINFFLEARTAKKSPKKMRGKNESECNRYFLPGTSLSFTFTPERMCV